MAAPWVASSADQSGLSDSSSAGQKAATTGSSWVGSKAAPTAVPLDSWAAPRVGSSGDPLAAQSACPSAVLSVVARAGPLDSSG